MTDTANTRDKHYRHGLTEPAAEFLFDRSEWLADPGSVRAVPNGHGGWDIMLRIDGTYSNADEAHVFAREFQQEVYGLAEQMRRSPDLWRGYETEGQCPACGEQSILSRRLNRCLHSDGSDNGRCWAAISRAR